MPSVPLSGDVVADKYEIGRPLGKGGMGVVLEARHKKLGQRVAIKFLMPDALASEEALVRFDREARAAALLRSPYVVRVQDVDTTEDGLPFIVMEYVEGRDLGSEIRSRGKIPVAEAVDWALQACAGLAEAHARGIVHRDIKPSNLYLCREATGQVVKVMDFGVSKLLGSKGEIDLTSAETAVGTPSYMAPEQLISARAIDHRVDVWAMGVVLYRAVSGRLPFIGENPTTLAIAIATAAPAPLAEVAPEVPRGLASAVMRALQREPDARYADMIELGRALEPFGTRRFAFEAAVAGLVSPPLPSEDVPFSVAQPATDDPANAPTEGAWAGQRAREPTSAPRGRAPIAIAIGLLVSAIVGGGLALSRRAAPPAAATAPIGEAAGEPTSEGAFASPPLIVVPSASEPAPPESPPSAVSVASAQPRAKPRAPAPPRSSASAASAPSAPSVPPEDPLHL
ncbi:MAG: serine/threonine protein kinase [Labilithrix sp.]|nr:serine/threonine protein kinase [Labilithrix sp.]